MSPARRAALSARKVTRQFSRTTVEVLAEAYDHGCPKRNTSLRILLGMLYSHSLQITALPITIQEGILRRVVAQLIGRPDMPMPMLALLYAVLGQWRVMASAMKREQQLFTGMDKQFAKQFIEHFFAAWAEIYKDIKTKQRSATKVVTMLSGVNGKQLMQFIYEEWKHGFEKTKQKMVQQRMFMSVISHGSNDAMLRNGMMGWTMHFQTYKAEEGKKSSHQQQVARYMSLLDQGNAVCLTVTYFGVWQKEVREGLVAAERLREKMQMKENAAAMRLRTLKASFLQQGDFLKVETFRCWVDVLFKLRDEQKRLKQLLAVMGMGQSTLMLKTYLNEWSRVLQTRKATQGRLRQTMLTFVNETQLTFENCFKSWLACTKDVSETLAKSKKFLMGLLASSDAAVLSTSFGSWRDLGQKERKIKEQRQARDARQQAVMKSLHILCGEQAMALCATCFHSWERIARMERAEKDKKNKEAASLGKTLQMIFYGDAQLLRSNAFRGWHMALVQEQNDRRLEAATKRHEAEKEAKRKTMMVMFHSNDQMMVLNTFQAWARSFGEEKVKQARAQKMMRWMAEQDGNGLLSVVIQAWCKTTKDNIYSSRKKGSATRMMGLVAEGNDQMELAKVFHGWTRLIETRKQNLQANAKLLTQIGSHDAQSSKRFVFQEWFRLIDKNRQERRRGQEKEKKMTQASRLVENMMLSSLQGCLQLWRQCVMDVKTEKAQKAQVEMLGMMMGGLEGPMLLTKYVTAWVNAISDRKQDEQLSKCVKDLAAADAQKEWTTGKICQDESTMQIMNVFLHWAHATATNKYERFSTKWVGLRQQYHVTVNGLLHGWFTRDETIMLLQFLHNWRWQIAAPKSKSRAVAAKTHAAMSVAGEVAPMRAAFLAWKTLTKEKTTKEKSTTQFNRVAQASLVRWLAADAVMRLSSAMRAWAQETSQTQRSAQGRAKAEELAAQARANAEEAARWREQAEQDKAKLSRTRQAAVAKVGLTLEQGSARAAMATCFSSWQRICSEGKATKQAVGVIAGLTTRGLLLKSWAAWRSAAAAHEPDADGRPSAAIYAFGGFGPHSPAEAERLDVASGRWEPVPRMPTPRCAAAAVCLGGRIYVVGGFCGREHLNSMDRFDPRSRRWEHMPEMSERRGYVAAAGDGDSLFTIGGFNGTARLSSVERFSPAMRCWSRLPPMSMQRQCAAAASLGGLVYVAGGDDGSGSVSTFEAFDPAAACWRLLPPMRTRRSGAAAAVVRGRIVVVGGSDGEPLGSAEQFEPGANAWSALPAMRVRRDALGAAAVGDSVYVFGGHDGLLRQRSMEVLGPRAQGWEERPEHSLGRNFAAIACGPC